MVDLKALFQKDTAQGLRCYGVVGHPLGHTLSPVFQNEAIRQLGLKAVYKAMPVAPEDWKEFLLQARDVLHGFNITVPYKEKILEDPALFPCRA